MFSSRKMLAALLLAVGVAPMAVLSAESYPGIGRDATLAEVAAWDIDVRPDFQGLPPGSGSVDFGMDVWEGKCASCHGIFGESNSVFFPLTGGTGAGDVETGHVATLLREDYPARSTMMKVSSVSTLWDYINRAMPWNEPKSLSVEEVYAVTAYLLNLSDVLPGDFVLSNKNMAEVQDLMPNRHGMTLDHAMWPGDEFGTGDVKPDVQATACMSDCEVPEKVTSMLPEAETGTWGNLADQNRLVGPQRGMITAESDVTDDGGAQSPAALALDLIRKRGCTACHGVDAALVGPALTEIAARHAGKTDYLAERIVAGSQGGWGDIPMPPQNIREDEARSIAAWLADGAPR